MGLPPILPPIFKAVVINAIVIKTVIVIKIAIILAIVAIPLALALIAPALCSFWKRAGTPIGKLGLGGIYSQTRPQQDDRGQGGGKKSKFGFHKYHCLTRSFREIQQPIDTLL